MRNAALDRIEQFGEVAMAGIELGMSKGDADHRALQFGAGVAHRAGKGSAHVGREIRIAVDLQVAQKSAFVVRFARWRHDRSSLRCPFEP
jgi:hypothetical protein